MILEEVSLHLKSDLIIEAYDEDTIKNKLLGKAKPLQIESLTKSDNLVEYDEELKDQKGKKSGNVTFSVKYIWEKPDAPKVKRD